MKKERIKEPQNIPKLSFLTKFAQKNHRGLTPLENFDVLDIYKTWLFWLKKHSFLSRISTNHLFCLIRPKIHKIKIFDKNPGLTACKSIRFFLLQFQVSSAVGGRESTTGNASAVRRLWTNPFEKFRFFKLFYNFTFLVKKQSS